MSSPDPGRRLGDVPLGQVQAKIGELEAEFPGLLIWSVPRATQPTLWCARDEINDGPVVAEQSPEALAEALRLGKASAPGLTEEEPPNA